MKSPMIPALSILCATAAFASDGGGAHSGAVDAYVTANQVAPDATNFSISSIKAIQVPTTQTVTGQPCLASDEYPQDNCQTITPGGFVPAYRVTIAYTSSDTQMSSDEYPQGDDWTTDFVLPVSALNAGLVKSALATSGKTKKAALQAVFAQIKTTPVTGSQTVYTKECAYDIVGETEWVKEDPNCQDEYAIQPTGTVSALNVELVPAN